MTQARFNVIPFTAENCLLGAGILVVPVGLAFTCYGKLCFHLQQMSVTQHSPLFDCTLEANACGLASPGQNLILAALKKS